MYNLSPKFVEEASSKFVLSDRKIEPEENKGEREFTVKAPSQKVHRTIFILLHKLEGRMMEDWKNTGREIHYVKVVYLTSSKQATEQEMQAEAWGERAAEWRLRK